MYVKPIDRMGRRLGETAVRTKYTFLMGVEREMEVSPWRTMSVSEVAARACRKVGAFYQYWYTLEDAVLELSEAKLEADEPLSERHQVILHLISLGRE